MRRVQHQKLCLEHPKGVQTCEMFLSLTVLPVPLDGFTILVLLLLLPWQSPSSGPWVCVCSLTRD